MKNYYKILGVHSNASIEDIKKNYLKLAHIYHPDKNGGDDEKFKEINEAYQYLSDNWKRKDFDTENEQSDSEASNNNSNEDHANQTKQDQKNKEKNDKSNSETPKRSSKKKLQSLLYIKGWIKIGFGVLILLIYVLRAPAIYSVGGVSMVRFFSRFFATMLGATIGFYLINGGYCNIKKEQKLSNTKNYLKKKNRYILIFAALFSVIILAIGSVDNFKGTEQIPVNIDNTNKEILPAVDIVPNIDTDRDGLTDAREVRLGTDPTNEDTDADGLFDREEVEVYKTNPLNPDTDGDTFTDGAEVEGGYNPNGNGSLLRLPRWNKWIE